MIDIGVQTYTIRKAQKKSISDAYLPLIELGIKNYEISRIDFSRKNALLVKELIKKHGIEATAIQVKPKYVFNFTGKIIEFCKITGCKNVIISMLPFRCILGKEAKFYEFISLLDSKYEEYEKYGITPNTKTYLEDRATLLHAAEDILMDEVPVTPIIANQYASLTNNGIKKIKNTYTNPIVLTKTTVSGYKSYLQDVEDFLEANFQSYCADRESYIYNKFKGNDKVYSAGEFSYEGFKGESSHYSFLFEDENGKK